MARERFYYGWVIVAVGLIVQALNGGIPGYVLGVFLKPMSGELGWTRAMFSSVESLSSVVSGFIAPLVGPVVDKRGPRALIIYGTVISGAGFAALGLVRGLWDFYIIRAIVLPVGLSCAGSLTVTVAVSNWFIRKRGKAISIAGVGMSLGGLTLVPFVTYIIAISGWRLAWMALGVIVWAVIIPSVALFMKRRPEDSGLLPDGGQGSGARGRQAVGLSPDPRPPTPEETWTRSEAMRTSTLWLLVLTFSSSSMGGGVTGIHFFSFLTDIGLTMATAAGVVSVLAVSVFLSRLSWGALVDRYHARPCGVVVLALCSVFMAVLFSLSRWPSLWLTYFAAVLMGFSVGGQLPVQEVLWADYFGRRSLGAIRSIAFPFTHAGSSVGPLFAGWIYDRFGSYQFAFAVFTVTYALAAVLIYFARSPRKKL